jgi:hypothetical protein
MAAFGLSWFFWLVKVKSCTGRSAVHPEDGDQGWVTGFMGASRQLALAPATLTGNVNDSGSINEYGWISA